MANGSIKYMVTEGGNRFEDLEGIYTVIKSKYSKIEKQIRTFAQEHPRVFQEMNPDKYSEIVEKIYMSMKELLVDALSLESCMDDSYEDITNIPGEKQEIEEIIKYCPKDIKTRHAKLDNLLRDVRLGNIDAYADNVPADTYNKGSQMIH